MSRSVRCRAAPAAEEVPATWAGAAPTSAPPSVSGSVAGRAPFAASGAPSARVRTAAATASRISTSRARRRSIRAINRAHVRRSMRSPDGNEPAEAGRASVPTRLAREGDSARRSGGGECSSVEDVDDVTADPAGRTGHGDPADWPRHDATGWYVAITTPELVVALAVSRRVASGPQTLAALVERAER